MKTRKGFETRCIAGENIVVATGVENINFSRIVSLNESAAYLWQEVADRDFSVDTLAKLLTDRYGINQQQAVEDSQALIKAWLHAEITTE